LGGVYLALGEYERAEAMFRQALEIWRRLPEANVESILATLNNLGVTLQEADKLPEAEQVSRDNLARTIQAHGEEDSAVATALHNLASVLFKQGKLKEA